VSALETLGSAPTGSSLIQLPPHCRGVMVMFRPALIVGFLWREFAQRRQIVPFAPSSMPKVELLRFNSTASVGRRRAENCRFGLDKAELTFYKQYSLKIQACRRPAAWFLGCAVRLRFPGHAAVYPAVLPRLSRPFPQPASLRRPTEKPTESVQWRGNCINRRRSGLTS